jgi:phosphoribosylformylglycinamidine synthase
MRRGRSSRHRIPVCVLRGLGINADEELESAFSQVGAEPHALHVIDLTRSPERLRDYRILALPGGFSYGDHLGSGRVLAALLAERLGAELREFVASGALVIGICNGFQVLVKAGFLPDTSGTTRPEASLIHNESGRFEDRWVSVAFPSSRSVWTRGLGGMDLPVRHGEGKFVTTPQVADRLVAGGQIAVTYARTDGTAGPPGYPDNPNGSELDIAGVCDPTGRILGLMPHPEAYLAPENHPLWTRDKARLPLGTEILRRGVDYLAGL